jgi:uncharacterized protein (TIGR00369 family)
MDREVPEGFERLPQGMGFTDVLQPVYRKEGKPPAIGMFVEETHTNLLNICHGGVLMTLADLGAAWAVNSAREEALPAPTLNLGFDFIAAARRGDWIQAQADRVTVKKRVGFSSGVISSGERVICRFSGTFYLPDPGAFEFDRDRMAVAAGHRKHLGE